MFRSNRLFTAALLILMMNSTTGQITCSLTEYLFRGECCYKCLPGQRVGTDCDRDNRTTCLPCTEGTYMNIINSDKSCFPCTRCEGGSGLRIKRSCSKTADTRCEPKEGFYCTEPTEHGCRGAARHKSCAPGEYVRQEGSSNSDTECSPCSAGTFSDGTSASCQGHTGCESLNLIQLKPGTESEDAQCGEKPSKIVIKVPVVTILLLLVTVVLAAVFLYMKWENKSQINQTTQNVAVTHV